MTTIELKINLQHETESIFGAVCQEYEREELFNLLEDAVKEKIKTLHTQIMDSE